MSVRQLLDRIEKMNVVDDKILNRIRREIDDPEKNVKAKGILSFLVKKEQITKKQAAKLLKETQEAAENISVKPEEPNVYDSAELIGVTHKNGTEEVDDLINLAKSEPVDVEPIEVDVEPIEVEVEPIEVEVEPIEVEAVEVEVEPVEIEPIEVEVEPIEVEVEPIEVEVEPEPVEVKPESIPKAKPPKAKRSKSKVKADPVPIAAPIEAQTTNVSADPLAGFSEPMSSGLDPAPYSPSESSGGSSGGGRGFQSKIENSDQWSSKWLYIGFGLLGTILISLAVLWFAVGRQNIEALEEQAEKSFTTGAYADAISKTEKLLELSPRSENADKWKVRIVHCQLAQPFERERYDEVLTVAESRLPDISELEAFSELRQDLARNILPTTAVALTRSSFANSTKSGATVDEIKGELDKVMRVEALVENPSYMPGSFKKMDTVAKQLDEVDDAVRGIENSIQKETDFQAAKVEIVELTDGSKTDEAFSVFDTLVKNYPDLGAREELQKLMRTVSVKEAELVVPAGMQLVGQQTEPESLVTNQVVVARRQGTPVNELSGETVVVLTEGVLYGYDAGEATVRWNRFMGFETHYFPQWTDKDNRDTLIVSDQKNNAVMKVNSADGSLVWRTEIGQPFANPCVTPEKVVVTTESGIVIGLNGETGDTFASVQLPQKTSVSAAASSRYPFFYQPGDYSNLYVLDANTLECREVVYLGHSPGSLTVPVFDWSGYITVLINQVDYCGLYLFKTDGDQAGLGLKRTQAILRLTDGHISTPFVKVGRSRQLAVSDTGNMNLLELNKVENPNQPVVELAKQNFRVPSGEKSFVKAKSSRLWIGNRGIERFKILPIGEFDRQPIAVEGNYILGPMAIFDDKLFHVRRRTYSSMSSTSAVDAQNMNEIWRSDLGAAFAGPPRKFGDAIHVVSGQGDRFAVDASAIETGYTDRGIVSSEISENLQFVDSISLANGSYVCIGSPKSREVLLALPDGTTSLERLQAPADSPACPIVAFGDSLVVASTKGQVVLANPANGRTIGNPFQPRKTPGVDTNWRKPAVVEGNKIVVGKDDGNVYLLTSDGRKLTRVAELKISGTLESGLVGFKTAAYGVTMDGAQSQLVGFDTTDDNFREMGAVKLEGGVVAGPWQAGGMIYLATDFGKLQAFSSDLNSEAVWSVDLGNDSLASGPIVSDGVVLLAMRSGKLMLLNSQSGEVQKEIEIGQPIMHAPLFDSGNIYVGSADGRLLVLPDSVF